VRVVKSGYDLIGVKEISQGKKFVPIYLPGNLHRNTFNNPYNYVIRKNIFKLFTLIPLHPFRWSLLEVDRMKLRRI
ncbi:MAG: hypothetical protein ACTSYQ_05140, partial [Candidatus Odinarchaeia archaeon]